MFPSSPLAQVKSIIAIAAGKGGVGKSTLTVNLALALTARGFRVGIMDTDIYGPSMRKMLKEDRLPHQKGDFIQPALCEGIKTISMAYFKKDHEPSIVRAPIALRFISQFIQNIQWGELDFLLIDFPPGTGDVQLTITQQIKLTGAIMITTPQEVAVLDVRKAMGMFDAVKVPIIGIVENMSYYQPDPKSEKKYLFGKGGGERLARETGSAFLGSIPIDPEISHCCDKGISLFSGQSADINPSIQAFNAIAHEVVAQIKELGSSAAVMKNIYQRDDFTLSIVWSNGKEQHLRLNELQKKCPCANCIDEVSGKQLLDVKTIKEEVRASSILPVGRYGLQIKFTTGCSTGIYSFESLRQME
jgi:ATP-binding protein involved in chromosome partitioning